MKGKLCDIVVAAGAAAARSLVAAVVYGQLVPESVSNAL